MAPSNDQLVNLCGDQLVNSAGTLLGKLTGWIQHQTTQKLVYNASRSSASGGAGGVLASWREANTKPAASSDSTQCSGSMLCTTGKLVKNAFQTIGMGVSLLALGYFSREIWRWNIRRVLFKKQIREYFLGKSIFVTGATSGIGEVLAYRLAGIRGVKSLYIHGRNDKRLAEVASKCNEIAAATEKESSTDIPQVSDTVFLKLGSNTVLLLFTEIEIGAQHISVGRM